MSDKTIQQAEDDLGATMLSAVRRSRKANIELLLTSISKTSTMMDGLPNLVEAMDELLKDFKPLDHEAGRMRLGKTLKEMRTHAEDCAGCQAANDAGRLEAIRAQAEEEMDQVSQKIKNARIVFSSVRALAKTQVQLARYVQHLSNLVLIYASSDSCSHDAASVADKLGHGEEALREFARQKFPGLFDKAERK